MTRRTFNLSTIRGTDNGTIQATVPGKRILIPPQEHTNKSLAKDHGRVLRCPTLDSLQRKRGTNKSQDYLPFAARYFTKYAQTSRKVQFRLLVINFLYLSSN